MKKRMLSLLVALTMAMAFCVPAYAAEPDAQARPTGGLWRTGAPGAVSLDEMQQDQGSAEEQTPAVQEMAEQPADVQYDDGITISASDNMSEDGSVSTPETAEGLAEEDVALTQSEPEEIAPQAEETAPQAEEQQPAEAQVVMLESSNSAGAGVAYGYLSAAQQGVYNAFLTACQDVENCSFAKVDTALGATPDDLGIATEAALYDHPEVFWTGGSYVYAYTNASGSTVVAGIGMDSNTRTIASQGERDAATSRLQNAAANLLAGVDRSGSAAEIALRVHDALAGAVTYDYASLDNNDYMPHTAYNALVNGSAVCDGYSKAYIYLLNQCGISASLVISDSLGHGWNLVQLDDGNWYETDVTWDDTSDGLRYTYYNLDTSAMVNAHEGSRNTTGVTGLLPTAYGTTYTYDAANGVSENNNDRSDDYGTGVEGFVTRLYAICLGREPDDAGKASWVSKLKSGATSGSEAAYGFVFSTEFKNKNYGNTEYVKQLYRAFMGREYDAAGLNNWVASLNAGTGREEVFNGFAQSAEFKKICEGYGIRAVAGSSTVNSSNSGSGVSGFVTRLYQVCLNRTPDAAGLRDWCNQLNAKTMTGREAAHGFLFSAEFVNKNTSNADYVEYLYQAFMGRGSDAAGKADWVAHLNQGWTREQVFAGFAGSQEFTNICTSYGIVRG